MPTHSFANTQPRTSPRATPSEMLRQVGNWALVGLIGTGQWSDVYAARPRDCAIDQPADYAVKIARASRQWTRTSRDMLQRERVVAGQVSDPHVITVLDAALAGDSWYLVLPRLEGSTIRTALDTYGRFSTAHALWIARQTAQALAAIHSAGWLHGDVKPGNIMVAPTGHVTLFDLGFALKLATFECQARDVIQGTMAYTAPEMISSTATVDQHADIYSLGITLYEMLTGNVPFAASNAANLLLAHLQCPVPNPRRIVPGLSCRVRNLIGQMTAKQPLRRPTIDELVWRLAELEIELFDDWAA